MDLSNITKTVRSVIALQNYVYSLIPWTIEPFIGSINGSIEKNPLGIQEAKVKFENKEIGGWCGLNAEFLRQILCVNNISNEPLDYGLPAHQFTHVCLLVELEGAVYLLDPYFNKIYKNKEGSLLTFPALIELIGNRRFDKIVSCYGESYKPIQTPEGFVNMKGNEVENSVIGAFKETGLDTAMTKIFGTSNPLLLMLIPNKPLSICKLPL
jgi:hypothetical protein